LLTDCKNLFIGTVEYNRDISLSVEYSSSTARVHIYMHSSERSCFKIRDDQCCNNYSLCIPKRQAPSVSELATSTSRRMRSRFLFRNGRPFRLVLNECLLAPFLPPTRHYFKGASPLSHPFDLDELKNLHSNMKATWFRMVRVGETKRVFMKIYFDPMHVI